MELENIGILLKSNKSAVDLFNNSTAVFLKLIIF